jgi:CDP-4-dehydro-6-deoxyglucose reductase
MPDPKFSKPWHGVPREQIHWNPAVIEDACIGCGTCVTGCSRLVYRFDFERKKAVVVDPLNCMVGCTTCANTCPAHAIAFPPIDSVLVLEGLEGVRHAIEDDLLARRDVLAATVALPHPDRIVALRVVETTRLNDEVLRVRLQPVVAGDCFCEFVPGQYLELWQPDSPLMSRAYSIANAPQGDGSVELHVRRVEGGRFTDWAFDEMKVGDVLKARGPLGRFTMRSAPDVPLLFVAGGTGFAPILALLRQQARSQPQRDMLLIWGAKRAQDFYALDELAALLPQLAHLRVVLAVDEGGFQRMFPDRLSWASGTVIDVLAQDLTLVPGRDLYAAGPPAMLRALGHQLDRWAVAPERVHVDSFGV